MTESTDKSEKAAEGSGNVAPAMRRARYSTRPAEGAVLVGTKVASPGMVMEAESVLYWERLGIVMVVAAICFFLLYQAELINLVDRWNTDPGWSHGFVVPIISGYFIWMKWDILRKLTPKPSWVGLAVLIFGVVGQMLFRSTGTLPMSHLSIVVVLFGAVLFLFGWEFLKILWLPVGFILFALPPPAALYSAMTSPMQLLAAQLGVALLPLFGASGFREGVIINVQSGSKIVPLNVEEACSGMRMLVAFFALAVALAYSTNRPMWQKVFLAVCALPIAILCNGLRVTLTGVMAGSLGGEWARGSTHQTVGLFMLIPAMGLQLGIAWILDKMFIDDKEPAFREENGKPANGGGQ